MGDRHARDADPYIIRTSIHGWRQAPDLPAIIPETFGSVGNHNDDRNVRLSVFRKPIALKNRTATGL